MKKYCVEYLEHHKMTEEASFSIFDEFQKLKEGESVQIKCDGYKFSMIFDKDDDCYLLVNGKEVSDEVILGFNIQKKDKSWSLLSVLIKIALLWLLSWGLILNFIPLVDRGTFGDMFGSVNSLFSGLALGGIIYTIFLQKKELKLQRKELRNTRKEFSIQNETLKQQRFENTFFKMIDLHNQITNNLSYTDSYYPTNNGKMRVEYTDSGTTVKIYNGLDVFKISWEIMSQFILNGSIYEDNKDSCLINTHEKIRTDYQKKRQEIIARHKNKSNSKEYSIELSQSLGAIEDKLYENLESDIVLRSFYIGYDSFYEKFEDIISQYLTNLYHIFKYILTTDLIEKDKKQFYASIVRSQLSQKEMLLIYFNSIIPDKGNPNFMYLIKEFDVMQNLNREILNESSLGLIIPIFDKMSENLQNPIGDNFALPVQIHQNKIVRSATW